MAKDYSDLLVCAVKYLIAKGITKSTEIAKRLDVSPYTVNSIKTMLRKRGEYPEPNSLKRGRKPKLKEKPKTEPEDKNKEKDKGTKKKKQGDIIDMILGL